MRKSFFWVFIVAVTAIVSLSFVTQTIAQAKTIELKFAYWSSPKSKTAKLSMEMLDRIEKRSKGRIKFNAYLGETLLKIRDTYRGVQLDVADMSYFGPGIPGNPIVLGKIISLPFMGLTSNEMTTAVYGRLLRESPELLAEYKGVKVLGTFGIPMDNFHLSKKAVHVPADIKGMKIITLGSRVNFLRDIGAIPVTIGVGEWYTSLERGLAEGLYFLFPVIPIFKLENQFKHHTIINGSATANMFIFNQKKWDSLPTDLQEVITEATEWRITEAHKRDRKEQETVIKALKEKGHTIYTPTPEEMKQWVEVAKPIHERWIKEVEAKGRPARVIYDRFKKFIEEYQKNKG